MIGIRVPEDISSESNQFISQPTRRVEASDAPILPKPLVTEEQFIQERISKLEYPGYTQRGDKGFVKLGSDLCRSLAMNSRSIISETELHPFLSVPLSYHFEPTQGFVARVFRTLRTAEEDWEKSQIQSLVPATYRGRHYVGAEELSPGSFSSEYEFSVINTPATGSRASTVMDPRGSTPTSDELADEESRHQFLRDLRGFFVEERRASEARSRGLKFL